MNEHSTAIRAVAQRAKETPDSALMKALSAVNDGRLRVSVGRENITVRDSQTGDMHRMSLEGVVPVGCEGMTECDSGYGCASEGGDTDGREPPCFHQVVVMSYLLNNPVELLVALKRFRNRDAHVPVHVASGGCETSHDLRAVKVTNDRAADVRVGPGKRGTTVAEHWALEHGVNVDPNDRVVLVEVVEHRSGVAGVLDRLFGKAKRYVAYPEGVIQATP